MAEEPPQLPHVDGEHSHSPAEPSTSSPGAELESKDVITKASDDTIHGTLSRSDSYYQRSFEPIRDGDRAELTRLATSLSRMKSIPQADAGFLTRRDTLADVKLGDSIIDPASPEFDVYKWARMMLRLSKEKGIAERQAGFIFKNLNVSGSGAAVNLQQTVGSLIMAPLRFREHVGKKSEKAILRSFDGIVRQGEMLIVLGRPGSGCSTFLKTITGEHHGLKIDQASEVHFNGIPQDKMIKEFKGDVVYNQEVDKHFPHLTVGETLEFAAAMRAPHSRPLDGVTRKEWVKILTKVVMGIFGLSHTYNTKVGNDFVRGVSGGERKRVSIAEMALAGSPIAAWDNATRGLDSATALEFVRSLRMASNIRGSTHAVAIYQASQAIYDVFDKAIVLYRGREIFYGPTGIARKYFEDMGWYCPPRQTTGDFLTSVTNPVERKAREGFETRVPRTPDEFEAYWRSSAEYAALQREIKDYEDEYPVGGEVLNQFKESKKEMQAVHMRRESPYTISIPMQIGQCTIRAYKRLWNDKPATVTTVFGQIVMAFIIGSIFYGTPLSTNSFFAKGAVLFFSVLLNALISITEINTLYAQRPIVEKHASYAFYHPFAEALAGIVSDLPVKFITGCFFNIILYFLAGLRTEPSQFFIFFLFNFIACLTMSSMFRLLAASTKTVSQALALAGVLVLAIVIYTGFTIPKAYMHQWFKWIMYINPVSYAFEAILVNEVHGRDFPCAGLVPPYPGLTGNTFVCPVAGAVAGRSTVSGDAWVESAYQYSYAHIWRNLGIMIAFWMFFMFCYLAATEFNSSTSSTAEVLVFRRGHVPKFIENSDEEGSPADAVAQQGDDSTERKANVLPPQTDIFSWRNVTYDITIKKEPRRLLDEVSGWVKPGTLTALMGVSGAGKTTLLDVLAQRTTMGIIHGDMLVSGKPLDSSFQRKTGYVQQQDLHLETSTVREALRFSAMLRQPKSVSKKEKYEFVESVIAMLNMEEFSEAVVGVPGEGLNVEQRKLLTIGVELAAKPGLLLFLDEPTSGLDSQSSWAIVSFLRKLAHNGQAVLSTIHQPSSILFQEFDRLLFLARGGKTVYFGEIGQNSNTLLSYFEGNGARRCGDDENPAEYMLEIVGAHSGTDHNWPEIWKQSPESQAIQAEIDRIEHDSAGQPATQDHGNDSQGEFAMPFPEQLKATTVRVFQQYWRTPSYIYGKMSLGLASALFIGFSFFRSNHSIQGVQDVIFSSFMLVSIFSTLVQQIMPRFVLQRSLYEVREKPSKAYSWVAFLMANIIVEIPYQILLGVIVFVCYYYPINGVHQASERQGLVLLLCIQFFVFASTFAHMVIVALPDAETAGTIATLGFAMSLIFNGVMQTPTALPGFWIFMYRVSPLTYLVSSIVSTEASGRAIVCAKNELAVFQPPSGQTCGDYMQKFLTAAGGNLLNPTANSDCQYCTLVVADEVIAPSGYSFSHRWRDYGIGWSYIVFNIFAAVVLYYMFRVRKWKKA